MRTKIRLKKRNKMSRIKIKKKNKQIKKRIEKQQSKQWVRYLI
jgi:hypothetical protein